MLAVEEQAFAGHGRDSVQQHVVAVSRSSGSRSSVGRCTRFTARTRPLGHQRGRGVPAQRAVRRQRPHAPGSRTGTPSASRRCRRRRAAGRRGCRRPRRPDRRRPGRGRSTRSSRRPAARSSGGSRRAGRPAGRRAAGRRRAGRRAGSRAADTSGRPTATRCALCTTRRTSSRPNRGSPSAAAPAACRVAIAEPSRPIAAASAGPVSWPHSTPGIGCSTSTVRASDRPSGTGAAIAAGAEHGRGPGVPVGPLDHVDRARRVGLGVAHRRTGRVERAERGGPLGGVLDQLAGDPAGRQRGQLRAGGEQVGQPAQPPVGREGPPDRVQRRVVPDPGAGRLPVRGRALAGPERPYREQLALAVRDQPVGHPQALADPVLHPDQLAAGHVPAEQPARGARRPRPGPAAGPGPAAPRPEPGRAARRRSARPLPVRVLPCRLQRTVSTPMPGRSTRTVTAPPAQSAVTEASWRPAAAR